MRQLFDIFATAVLYGGLFGLAAISLGVFIVGAVVTLRLWKRAKHCAVLAVLAFAAIIVGGTKTGSVKVDDPYIVDAGSFVTNDYVHIGVAARFDFIGDTEILIWSREIASTNVEDWVQLVRIEEGPYRLREFPLDIPFPGATNFNFLVASNYVPEPTVHTNGVWSIKGFVIPAGDGASHLSPPSPATFAFPNSKSILKEDNP